LFHDIWNGLCLCLGGACGVPGFWKLNTYEEDLSVFEERDENAVAWEWYKPKKEETVYAIDIETDYNWETKTGGENIIQGAVATSEGRCLVARDAWRNLMVEASKGQVVGHNSWAFDIPRLRDAGVPVAWGSDTLVFAYLLDETQPLNLEALCVKYLGVEPWKEEGHAAFEDTEKFALYNARDAVYTLRLYTYLLSNLGASPVGIHRARIADEILLPAKLALDECTRRGEYLDKVAIAGAKQTWEGHVQDDLATLLKMYDLPEKFNINAPQQVGKFLLDRGAPIKLSPKSQKPACDKEKLQYLAATDAEYAPFCRALVAYREIRDQLKVITKYEGLAQSEDGRIHPTYYAYKSMAWGSDKDEGGTVVGRTSCRNPNRQNLDRKFKHFFSAPPGKVLVSADYSALHFRIFGWIAQERTIIGKFQENPLWDAHTFFAARMYNKPESEVTKDERQIAKSANYSLLYLGQPITLQNYAMKMGLVLSIQTCVKVHAAWHRTFADAGAFYIKVRDELLEKGYVETPTGRRRHFDAPFLLEEMYEAPPRSWLNKQFTAYLREAVNHYVLGFEPDIALPALAECHRVGLPINAFCHDSISFEFDSMDEYLTKKPLIEDCMVRHPVSFLRDRFNVSFTAPLVVDFEVKEQK
jgi:DNA polymerase I-like protein with 3'-5' exonuclease and polymerase domains